MQNSANRARVTFARLALLYFVSGAVGLVDEVIFSKYLTCAFGATAQASSAVLVAFMTGLALGSAAIARFDDRIARPLIVYGVLEMAVGVACALSPWLFDAVTRVYASIASGAPSLAWLELLRGVLAGSVVLLPTVAMGATLPLVARVAGGSGDGGDTRVSLLYGANTAGGAVGSLLGAYVIVPSLGLAASLRAGATVSVLVGIAAVSLARRIDPAPSMGAPRVSTSRVDRGDSALLLAAASSGALVFASEVVFVHLLALIDGTSVYAFGLVLAVFLLALSVGAGLSRGLARLAGDNALSASLAISGLVLATTLPWWDRLPGLFVAIGPLVTSWGGREAVRGAVAALAIGLPAMSMGTTFPLALAAVAARDDRGARTARLTAVNTIASIVGSITAGFVLLPRLGSQVSCWVIALAYGIAALGVHVPAKPWTFAAAAGTAILIALAPRWDLTRLASGTNVYFERQSEQGAVIWIDEDVHGGVVTVTRKEVGPGQRAITTLWTNGKYQGDDGFQIAAQRGFADLPAMFVRHFDRALVVGLGTGTTLGALAQYPFARVDIAELSPGIVKAARAFFTRANGGVLDDPRVHVVLEDGRNVLLVQQSLYDLVTIELTSIWFAGAANLYSREFYATAAARLSDSGVLSQWIQLHHTTLREIVRQMATARAVFAHAAFFIRGDQGMLVMSAVPLRAHPRIPGDLDDLILADDTLDEFIDDVCSDQHTTRAAMISTDDDRRLEYATPRNNIPGMPAIAEMTAAIRKWRRLEVVSRVEAH
ncbi:MAG: spermidine synthase [Myxococcota bacterium]|nr:spermidine synthase [Myxococcota bacterium]